MLPLHHIPKRGDDGNRTRTPRQTFVADTDRSMATSLIIAEHKTPVPSADSLMRAMTAVPALCWRRPPRQHCTQRGSWLADARVGPTPPAWSREFRPRGRHASEHAQPFPISVMSQDISDVSWHKRGRCAFGTSPDKQKTRGIPRVSRLDLRAETEGFEPSVPVRGLHLSRVVH